MHVHQAPTPGSEWGVCVCCGARIPLFYTEPAIARRRRVAGGDIYDCGRRCSTRSRQPDGDDLHSHRSMER